VNCNIAESPNVMNGVNAFARDLLDRAILGIKKIFRRSNHNYNGELRLRVDERQPERQRVARPSMPLEHSFYCLRDEVAAGGAVRFRVFVSGQPKLLKPAIQEQMYLIGREALINAFRHSEGTSIEVEVEYLRRRLRILISDNGRGMDPEIVQSDGHDHWGLLGMRDRADDIGAQLRIWSRSGCGTAVEISIQAL